MGARFILGRQGFLGVIAVFRVEGVGKGARVTLVGLSRLGEKFQGSLSFWMAVARCLQPGDEEYGQER